MPICLTFPDSKVQGANTGPIWGRQDPGGPHVGPMFLAIWVFYTMSDDSLVTKKARASFMLFFYLNRNVSGSAW